MLTTQQHENLAIVIKDNLPSVGEINLTGDLANPILSLYDIDDMAMEVPDIATLIEWCNAWQAEQTAPLLPPSNEQLQARIELLEQVIIEIMGSGL